MTIKLGKYRHYKGNEYEVLGTVFHSETQEEMVLYKALYETEDHSYGTMWVRPIGMWNEMVEWNGMEWNGKKLIRFEFIGE